VCPPGFRSVGHISNEGTLQMIVIGVDTHERSHTLAALDHAGRVDAVSGISMELSASTPIITDQDGEAPASAPNSS
jgi:hypothetical protein